MTSPLRKPIDLKEGDIVRVDLDSLSMSLRRREIQYREWSKYLREHGLTLFFRRGLGCITRAKATGTYARRKKRIVVPA